MDQSLAKALEIGLAFLIFVAGLGYFSMMSQEMSDYIKVANAYEVGQAYSQLASESRATSDVGLDTLYFLLMESDLDHIYVDACEIRSLKKRLEVASGVSVFEAVEEIRLELDGLGYDYYSQEMIVDSEGCLVALTYKHR